MRLARILAPFALVVAVLAAACRMPATATPTAVPTQPPTPPIPLTSTAQATSGATATAPATAPAGTAPGRAPDLNNFAWGDRKPYRAGLTAGEQASLDGLGGASEYRIRLDIGSDLTRVAGYAAVRYTNREGVPLEAVPLRLYPNLLGGTLQVVTLSVNDQPGQGELDARDTVLWVRLPQPLAPDEATVISLDFTLDVPTDLERNYGVLAAADGVLALAHAYPLIPVYDDEGWNVEIPSPQGDVVYADASFYIVQVRAPARLVLAASGVTIDERTEGSQQVMTYAAGPARDFYLAGSADFEATSARVGETLITSYAPRGREAGSRAALEVARAALASYAGHYGPYPYSELDLVATPTLALGIEYPGILAITRELYDPAQLATSSGVPPALEWTVAHEVGHQWFYNLIGNDQLDEPWLDESVTQYVTWRYAGETHGPEGAQQFEANLAGRWARVQNADIPIGLPVSDYEGAEYSGIVYGRGPLFVEALSQALGIATFDEFLSDYAATYRWGIASSGDFEALAEAHCNCDLKALFDEWVR